MDPSRMTARGEPCAQSRKTRGAVHDDISSGEVNSRGGPVDPWTQHGRLAVALQIQIENAENNCGENSRADPGAERQAQAERCGTARGHA